VFFEFDPPLAHDAGDTEPERVWGRLADAGYAHCVVWNNFGDLLGSWPLADLPSHARILAEPYDDRRYHYWDVLAIHAYDPLADAFRARFAS
jgi:hypothetical protein